MALGDSLVGYWKLDGNANDSVGTNHGTVTNATVSATAIIGSSYLFDGVGDKIALTAFTISTGTIAFWIRPTSFADNIAVGRSSSVHIYIDLLNSSTITTQSGSGNVKQFTVPTMSSGSWYHVAMVRDGTGVRVYLNGSESSSGSQTITTNFTFDQFGAYYNAAGNGLVGNMDEVGLWSRALAASEITQLYNSGSGLTYPFTTGWSKKMFGVTPSKINGISVSSISKVNGL